MFGKTLGNFTCKTRNLIMRLNHRNRIEKQPAMPFTDLRHFADHRAVLRRGLSNQVKCREWHQGDVCVRKTTWYNTVHTNNHDARIMGISVYDAKHSYFEIWETNIGN